MNERNILVENRIVLNLVSALAGLMSPNFKSVSFWYDASSVTVDFELYCESKVDLKEIEEIVFELVVLMAGFKGVKYTINYVGSLPFREDRVYVFLMKK